MSTFCGIRKRMRQSRLRSLRFLDETRCAFAYLMGLVWGPCTQEHYMIPQHSQIEYLFGLSDRRVGPPFITATHSHCREGCCHERLGKFPKLGKLWLGMNALHRISYCNIGQLYTPSPPTLPLPIHLRGLAQCQEHRMGGWGFPGQV
jgi:hypothetical protein